MKCKFCDGLLLEPKTLDGDWVCTFCNAHYDFNFELSSLWAVSEIVRLRALEQAAIELVRANNALSDECDALRGDQVGSIKIPKDSLAAMAGDRDTEAAKCFWLIAREMAEAAEARQVQGVSNET